MERFVKQISKRQNDKNLQNDWNFAKGGGDNVESSDDVKKKKEFILWFLLGKLKTIMGLFVIYHDQGVLYVCGQKINLISWR